MFKNGMMLAKVRQLVINDKENKTRSLNKKLEKEMLDTFTKKEINAMYREYRETLKNGELK